MKMAGKRKTGVDLPVPLRKATRPRRVPRFSQQGINVRICSIIKVIKTLGAPSEALRNPSQTPFETQGTWETLSSVFPRNTPSEASNSTGLSPDTRADGSGYWTPDDQSADN